MLVTPGSKVGSTVVDAVYGDYQWLTYGEAQELIEFIGSAMVSENLVPESGEERVRVIGDKYSSPGSHRSRITLCSVSITCCMHASILQGASCLLANFSITVIPCVHTAMPASVRHPINVIPCLIAVRTARAVH